MKETAKIKLPPRSWFLQRGIEIPGYVWKQGAFVFHPEPFVPNHERVSKKVYEPSHQLKDYNAWRTNPSMFDGSVYFCASEPNDARAAYFAAHLLSLWLKSVERTNKVPQVRWITCRSPDWQIGKSILEEDAPCDFLVLANITPNSSKQRLERIRDLVVSCPEVPVILVIAGEDPITFATQRLFLSVNAVFFHTSQLMKRAVEFV